jgi:hypothetical protein
VSESAAVPASDPDGRCRVATEPTVFSLISSVAAISAPFARPWPRGLRRTGPPPGGGSPARSGARVTRRASSIRLEVPVFRSRSKTWEDTTEAL